MLKQANTDSSRLAEVIGILESQLSFVTNTSAVMGLIKCGSAVIPFDNTINDLNCNAVSSVGDMK